MNKTKEEIIKEIVEIIGKGNNTEESFKEQVFFIRKLYPQMKNII